MLWRQADTLVALDRKIGAAYDAVTQDLSEGVNGVRVIKAFGLGDARSAILGGTKPCWRKAGATRAFMPPIAAPTPSRRPYRSSAAS